MRLQVLRSKYLVISCIVTLAIAAACSSSSSGTQRAVLVTITTPTLPRGSVGSTYSFMLAASGGALPYTWSLVSGPLPPGISLATDGSLTGTPTVMGSFPLTVAVADNQVPPATDMASLNLTILPVLSIQTTSLPDAFVGLSYSTTLVAADGVPPYAWGIIAGVLPAGLVLGPNGNVSGTPIVAGIFPLTFEVTDSQSPGATATAAFDLLVFTPSGINIPPCAGPCTPMGIQRGLVEFCYALSDIESDPVTITVEYSTDSGVSYLPATEGPAGQGTGPHASSPPATFMLYVWDSLADIGPVLSITTRLRITPADADPGLPSASGDFTVDNRPGQGLFVMEPGSLNSTRMRHTATLLGDGTVLVTGGVGSGGVVLDSAEIYSPVLGFFLTLPSTMTTPRSEHTATLLPDGTVLIAGGVSTTAGPELSSAEIFDPVAVTFTATGSMTQERAGHSAAPTATGAVIAGGFSSVGPPLIDMAEEFDPISGTFSPPATLLEGRSRFTATALPPGRVLLVGGSSGLTLTAEEFNPVTGTSPIQHTFLCCEEIVYHSSSLLQNGMVLMTGGSPGPGIITITNAFDLAYLYDSSTGFASVGPMLATRRRHTSTTLVDGRVLVAGGQTNGLAIQADSEVYDIASGFSATGFLNVARMYHTAVLLQDGRVQVVGGTTNGTDPIAGVETYHP